MFYFYVSLFMSCLISFPFMYLFLDKYFKKYYVNNKKKWFVTTDIYKKNNFIKNFSIKDIENLSLTSKRKIILDLTVHFNISTGNFRDTYFGNILVDLEMKNKILDKFKNSDFLYKNTYLENIKELVPYSSSDKLVYLVEKRLLTEDECSKYIILNIIRIIEKEKVVFSFVGNSMLNQVDYFYNLFKDLPEIKDKQNEYCLEKEIVFNQILNKIKEQKEEKYKKELLKKEIPNLKEY